MTRSVQPDEVIIPFEIWLGDKIGSPHEGGRRGHLAFDGEVPQAIGVWMTKLRAHALPERFGAVSIYANGELVSKRADGSLADDPEEVRTRSAMFDVETAEADVRSREGVITKLELRQQTLVELVRLASERVALLRREEAELVGRIEQERQRVVAEVARLDADLATFRANCTATKNNLMVELAQYSEGMKGLQANISVAFDGIIAKTVADATAQQRIERSVEQDAVARRMEAVAHTSATVELLQNVEKAGLHTLLPGAGEARQPGPGAKFLYGLADWATTGGGADRVVNMGERILDHVLKPKSPKT